MTNPSIALIPSAYKTSKLYSVMPNDGNGDFTHVRASVATRVNESGLIEEVAADIPRLDYLNESCPVLLLEPQTTNLIIRSQEFDAGTWGKTRCTITANDKISPDGSRNAETLLKTENANEANIKHPTATIAAGMVTASVFIRKSNIDWAHFFFHNGVSVGIRAWFNLNTGVVGTTSTAGSGFDFVSSEIQDYGNGWFRCILTCDSGVFTAARLQISPSGGDGVTATSIGDEIELFGAQMEQLEYSTSYTETVSSSVTRIADQCKDAGTSAEFNDSEGVIYCEIASLFDNLTARLITISDATTVNRVYISYGSNSNEIRVAIIDGGVTQASMAYTVADTTEFSKVAIKYKLNDCALWVDGVERATDTVATMPSGLSEVSFDGGSGSNDFLGKCRELRVYTTALTDAELTTLTT